jgi:hypothetical protein
MKKERKYSCESKKVREVKGVRWGCTISIYVWEKEI